MNKKQKPPVCWMGMIYPTDFKQQMENFDVTKTTAFQFLKQDFVFCKVHLNLGWRDEDDFWNELVAELNVPHPMLVFFDEEAVAAHLTQLSNYLKSGLWAPGYYTTILQESVFVKSTSDPANLACRSIACVNPETGATTSVMLFASSNPSLLEDPHFDGLKILADQRLRARAGGRRGPKPDNKRPSLTKSIRFEVLHRDGFKCKHCGATKDDAALHIDHIKPVALGGTDTMDNLQTLCQACNLSKSKRVLP